MSARQLYPDNSFAIYCSCSWHNKKLFFSGVVNTIFLQELSDVQLNSWFNETEEVLRMSYHSHELERYEALPNRPSQTYQILN